MMMCLRDQEMLRVAGIENKELSWRKRRGLGGWPGKKLAVLLKYMENKWQTLSMGQSKSKVENIPGQPY